MKATARNEIETIRYDFYIAFNHLSTSKWCYLECLFHFVRNLFTFYFLFTNRSTLTSQFTIMFELVVYRFFRIVFLFPFLQAVKRSRVKSKQRASQTKDRVDDLKVENEKLQERINQKHNQLKVLKELFLDTAKAKQESGVGNINLQSLLADSDGEGASGSKATWSKQMTKQKIHSDHTFDWLT